MGTEINEFLIRLESKYPREINDLFVGSLQARIAFKNAAYHTDIATKHYSVPALTKDGKLEIAPKRLKSIWEKRLESEYAVCTVMMYALTEEWLAELTIVLWDFVNPDLSNQSSRTKKGTERDAEWLNNFLFTNTSTYFLHMDRILGIKFSEDEKADYINPIYEIKASRNSFIHRNGAADDKYVKQSKEGVRPIPQPDLWTGAHPSLVFDEDYLRDCVRSLKKLVDLLCQKIKRRCAEDAASAQPKQTAAKVEAQAVAAI